MAELGDFGLIVLIVAGGVMLALLVRKLSSRFPIPAPALFLLAAAVFPVVFSDIRTVERIAVVALIVILFDGGLHVGWRRFRRVSPYVQSLLVDLLLLMFFSSINAAMQLDPTKPLQGVLCLLPPMWFLGLYQHQLGWHQLVFRQLTGLGQHALAVAALVAAVSYGLSYKRSISRSLDDLEGARERWPGRFAKGLTLLLHRILLLEAVLYGVHILDRLLHVLSDLGRGL